jgi:hypothetical protein
MNKSISDKSRSQQFVDIEIWAEVFLMRLLGKPMLYKHGKRSNNTWMSILSKLINSIEKAIEKNIDSDGLHELRLQNYIRQLKEVCKEKDNNPPDILLPLIGIIFELLGGMPDYSHRSRINRKSDYELFHMRSVGYTQSSYQKVKTILEASKQKPFYDQHRYDELFEIYVTRFNGDSDGFIKWYKQEYPGIYLQLF